MTRRSALPNASRSKRALHECGCPTCKQHPYSKIAKEHTAINRVLLGLDERNKRRFVGLLASQRSGVIAGHGLEPQYDLSRTERGRASQSKSAVRDPSCRGRAFAG